MPLVPFDRAGIPQALRASLAACLHNLLPLAAFAASYAGLGLVASLPFGLGFLVLAPVGVGAGLAAFDDLFGPADPSPGAGADSPTDAAEATEGR